MNILAIILAFLCCVSMFFVRLEYKVGLMILGTLVFTLVNIPVLPVHNVNILLPLCFLLSEIRRIEVFIRLSRGKTVWILMRIFIVMSVLTICSSPHLHSASSLRDFLQNQMFFKYFALLYAYWAFSTEDSIKPTLKITFYGLIVLTIFGVINYLTKSADFVSSMTAGWDITSMGNNVEDAGQVFADRERFRVQAMFINPFDYGYICILMLILHIYGYTKGYENKGVLLCVVACSLFGIVSCGCRTNIFCFLVGVSVFYLFAFKLGKTLRFLLIFIFTVALLYQMVPLVGDTVDNMLSMFDKQSNVGGSSMELRTLQYGAVLYHIQNNPLFGCGYHYFVEDMGWGQGLEYLKDPRLAGLEGVAMSYILERGFVGFALYLLFYITILVSFIRCRRYAMLTTAFGISVVSTYLSFANMTGELLSVYPTLLLLGYVFKVIDYNRQEGSNVKDFKNMKSFV